MLKKSSSTVATFALMMAIGVSPKFLTNFPLIKIRPANAQSSPQPVRIAEGTMVKIDGTTAAETINQVFQQRFQAENPGAQVDLNYQGTEKAIKAVQTGGADLATIGRPLTDQEKAAGLEQSSLGRYKVAIIVSEKNPFANSLTDQQFARIFRGEITNWSELGGPNKAISFIDRPEYSDTRQAFNQYPIFQQKDFAAGSTAVPVTTDETKAVIEKLGDSGIGYAIADQVINSPGIRVLPLHKVLPTDKKYSFSIPLYYVYKKDNPPVTTKSFLGYVNTPSNQQVITQLRDNIVIPPPLPAIAISPSPRVNNTGSPTIAASPDTKVTASPSVNNTGSPTITASPDTKVTTSPSVSPSQNPNTTATVSPSATPTATADPNTTATVSPSATPTATADPNTTATVSPSATPTATADPNTTATVSPSATPTATLYPNTTDTTDTVQPDRSQPDATTTNKETGKVSGGLPWWLWLLGIPLLGGLLWFLLHEEEEDAIMAAGVTDKKANRIILTPRDCKNAYAYWEVSQEKLKQARHSDNDHLAVRIHDVTNIDIDRQESHSIKQYDCTEVGQQDMHVPISQDNRDYLAELGYVDNDGKWYVIMRSAPVRVPPCLPDEKITTETAIETTPVPPTIKTEGVSDQAGLNLSNIAPMAAATATGAVAISNLTNNLTGSSADIADHTAPSRLVLVPRNSDDLYAYWELNTTEQNNAKASGGEKLTLRLSDVTGIKPGTDKAHSVKEYECSELDQDLHIVVPADHRQYQADLGYVTTAGDWLPLASSNVVDFQIVSKHSPVPPVTNTTAPPDINHTTNSETVTNNTTDKTTDNTIDNTIDTTTGTDDTTTVTDTASQPESFADKLKGKVSNLISKGENITDQVSETVKGKFADLVVEGGELKEKIQDRLRQPESLENPDDLAKENITDTKNITDTAPANKNVLTGLGAGLAAAAGGAIASAMGKTDKSEKTVTNTYRVNETRIILVPRYFRDAYAYWEIEENQKNQAKQNGGQQLTLRICNVTNDHINQSSAKIIEFSCNELTQDLHLTVPDSGDYLAEIGYKTSDGMWISLAKSEIVHIPVSSAR